MCEERTRPSHCAHCGGTSLESYCHLPPAPLFGCLDCDAQLNGDGSVCAAYYAELANSSKKEA